MITLRPADDGDLAFAFEAKKRALGPHVSVRWGWDDTLQMRFHRRRWAEKPWFIILHGGEPIGTVSIGEEGDGVRFGEFYLLPEHQNRGLGTQVLRELLARCDAASQRVRLEYLKWNPVGTLYTRHGFRVVGEDENHFYMERDPSPLA